MDGVRAYWNGEKLISRHGKEIPCPNWFVEELSPDIKLDGELWIGRGQYEDVFGMLHDNDERIWKSARYVIFDLPSSKKPYEARMVELKDISLPPHVEIISSRQCKGNDELFILLNDVINHGGEG